MIRRKKLAGAVAGVAMLTAGLTQASAGAEEADMNGKRGLTGTWVVTVDPRPTPAGDQPPFESTLAYFDEHVVSEITTRGAMATAGLGGWRKVGGSTYTTSWHKYRFDATGAYIGKTVINETIELTGATTYSARAVTKIVSPTGAVVAQFETDATAVRMRR